MVCLAQIWRKIMKNSKYRLKKNGTAQALIVANSEAVAVDYAELIAKAATVVRQRQQQYALNRGKTSVDEPRNGILLGFVAR
jgi:hypothetical protein